MSTHSSEAISFTNTDHAFSSYVFQGIIMGTVFLRMPEATSAYFSRGGVLFL